MGEHIFGIRKNLWNETKKCYEELQDPFSTYQLEKMKVSLDEMVRLATAICLSMEIAENLHNTTKIESMMNELRKKKNISPASKALIENIYTNCKGENK